MIDCSIRKDKYTHNKWQTSFKKKLDSDFIGDFF